MLIEYEWLKKKNTIDGKIMLLAKVVHLSSELYPYIFYFTL